MSTIQLFYVPLSSKHTNTVKLASGSERIVPEFPVIKFPDEKWEDVIPRLPRPEIKQLLELDSPIKCLIVTHRYEGDVVHNRPDRKLVIHTRTIGLAASNQLVHQEITTEEAPKWLEAAFKAWLIGAHNVHPDKAH